MSNPLIEMHGIRKVFDTEEVETWALDDIHLRVDVGDYLAIGGPSGCGKSTLLSILGLLDSPTQGEYLLEGEDVTELNHAAKAAVRNRQIGFIFQAFNLIADMTVFENVELPLTYRRDLNRRERKELVVQVLERVEMAHRASHFPSQLSGGQQQRVAIARALAGRPAVLLADEPTGNLDSKNAQIVMGLLEDLHGEGSTICMVTHDPAHAERARRQITLFDGKVVDDSYNEPMPHWREASAWRSVTRHQPWEHRK